MSEPKATDADLLGRPLSEIDRDVLRLYRETKALCAREDLPPYMARNLRASLAALYQCVNGSNAEFEHLYDLGV